MHGQQNKKHGIPFGGHFKVTYSVLIRCRIYYIIFYCLFLEDCWNFHLLQHNANFCFVFHKYENLSIRSEFPLKTREVKNVLSEWKRK